MQGYKNILPIPNKHLFEAPKGYFDTFSERIIHSKLKLIYITNSLKLKLAYSFSIIIIATSIIYAFKYSKQIKTENEYAIYLTNSIYSIDEAEMIDDVLAEYNLEEKQISENDAEQLLIDENIEINTLVDNY